ncbi:hypothetical protein [Pseudomonas sp. S1(2024)]|uniref:hypothetical protein n=1 Tax=Pseudomonas sp. S1(2024) TaxID=3390191 RepID=UPI00397E0665
MSISSERQQAIIEVEKSRVFSLPISMREKIGALASFCGIQYVETNLDRLATVITRLSGDEVELDETERLVISLKRAGVLNKHEALALIGLHIVEKRTP